MRISIREKQVRRSMQIAMCMFAALAMSSCTAQNQVPSSDRAVSETSESVVSSEQETQEAWKHEYVKARARMVSTQLAKRDIVDQRVLDAMKKIPRHQFVPAAFRRQAYQDSPLPIGHQQTISQPYIVALMTQLVDPQAHEKALDIGTGSGYQAAVLAETVKSVYSIEIVEPLAVKAREQLKELGYKNVTVRHGDGYQGWKSEAPFDVIVVAAAPDHVPQPLIDQLAPGGKMVIPVGKRFQRLLLIEKKKDGSTVRKYVAPVAFVPMTGAAQSKGER